MRLFKILFPVAVVTAYSLVPLVTAETCTTTLPCVEHYDVISKDGFFGSRWQLHKSKQMMRVRQVPGDGSCLFHAIYVALAHATNGTHPSEPYSSMCRAASLLRRMAIDYLASDPSRVLSIAPEQDMTAGELLQLVASQMGITPQEYLTKLKDPKEWAGGPEIVALANALERPITLYELKAVGLLYWSRFCFKKVIECGAPCFSKNKSLHILIADSTFPDCVPYFHHRPGNHFLALFPCEEITKETVETQADSTANAGSDNLAHHPKLRGGNIWQSLRRRLGRTLFLKKYPEGLEE